jgi:hypothetical protein
MCRIYCGGFFEIAGSVVVISYVKEGTLEFCCNGGSQISVGIKYEVVVYEIYAEYLLENVRWNVDVVTANKQGPFVAAEGE